MSTQLLGQRRWPSTSRLLLLAGLGASLLWAYWTFLRQIAARWWDDPQYSHGFLVPVFCIYLLWWRRSHLAAVTSQTSWWALGLLAGAGGLRVLGAYLYINWLDGVSLLLALAAITLLLGSWPTLRWAWPALAFLLFMMPLPYRVETALAFPLRRLATLTSTYAIQTLGFPALAEGTEIYLHDNILRVAPACSGLGMLLVFFALSTGIVLLINRPWVDKLVILLSAVPIALLANVFRITVTAALFEFSTKQAAHKFFHDWAGLFMMPVGLALLLLELKVLDRLLVRVDARRPLKLALAEKLSGRAAPRLPKKSFTGKVI